MRKQRETNYCPAVQPLLKRFAAEPVRRTLLKKLKGLRLRGFHWAGQRVWFCGSGNFTSFQDNFWMLGDPPYADLMAAVELRFRKEGSPEVGSLLLEANRWFFAHCDAGREPWGGHLAAIWQLPSGADVIRGTRETDLESCAVPVALDNAIYPMLLLEPVLSALGLLLPELRQTFHAELDRNARQEYDWPYDWADAAAADSVPGLSAFPAVPDFCGFPVEARQAASTFDFFTFSGFADEGDYEDLFDGGEDPEASACSNRFHPDGTGEDEAVWSGACEWDEEWD